MHSDQLSKNKDIETNRPAPLLPGYYSVQTLSEEDVLPNITQYHRKPEPAIAWKNVMAKKRLFDAYLLCSSESRWDVFGRSGKAAGTKTSVTPKTGVFMEQHAPIIVDHAEYVESVQAILGSSVCCVTHAEHHAHASSVGHSNMVVVARQLVMDASDEDARHIYLADSVASGCRVQGWFIDMQAASQKLIDKYLDRYKWLAHGWPLANDHHSQVLSYRMATLRPMQILEILLTAANVVDLGEHKSLVSMRMQRLQPEIMIMFAARLLEQLEPAIRMPAPNVLEYIDEQELFKQAPHVAKLYREAFL
jgi:hypothetical protein